MATRAEQKAYDMGLMDKFVQFTDDESCALPDHDRDRTW